jgi:hypothetical protein
MKDRVILLASLVLAVTVALFAWFTWAHWGVVGVYPVVGRMVIGAAVFALAFAGLFSLSRPRTNSVRPAVATPPAAGASQPSSRGTCQEVPEETKVTSVELS